MFHKEGYVIVDDIFHPQLINYLGCLAHTTIPLCQEDPGGESCVGSNGGSKNAVGGYKTDLGESLLKYLTNTYNKISGKNLTPTYSYFRTYYKDNNLLPHTDRGECEYSATIQLLGKDIYPIFIESRLKQPIKLFPKIGSVVFYKGIELLHWREKLEFDMSSHVFLH